MPRFEEIRLARLFASGWQVLVAQHTLKSLEALWRVSQSPTSTALAALTQLGYLHELPRSSSQATRYAPSGTSRQVLG